MAEIMTHVELSASEQAVVDHLRMTPAERQAEVEAKRQERLAMLTPAERQAEVERSARIEAMTATERRAYLSGQRIVGIARAIRRDAAKGVGLVAILAAVESVSQQDVDWLINELKKTE